jgi:predicted CoA-substrate-specific enzyme activase
MGYYLGIDVGSITTKMVVLDESDQVLNKVYLRNSGRPLEAIQQGMEEILKRFGNLICIDGVATTGSARHLAAYLVGADLIKNEITAHAIAVTDIFPEAKTIIEIGGQDSKVIALRGGVVIDFAMNTVCAAGTGSFLDQQAFRLGIDITEFSELALMSESVPRLAGRCSVFAKSDMIHLQQQATPMGDILAGLCVGLARNLFECF